MPFLHLWRNNADGVGLDDRGHNPFESIPSSIITPRFLEVVGKTDFTVMGKFVCMFFVSSVLQFLEYLWVRYFCAGDTLGERRNTGRKSSNNNNKRDDEEEEEEGRRKKRRSGRED